MWLESVGRKTSEMIYFKNEEFNHNTTLMIQIWKLDILYISSEAICLVFINCWLCLRCIVAFYLSHLSRNGFYSKTIGILF